MNTIAALLDVSMQYAWPRTLRETWKCVEKHLLTSTHKILTFRYLHDEVAMGTNRRDATQAFAQATLFGFVLL